MVNAHFLMSVSGGITTEMRADEEEMQTLYKIVTHHLMCCRPRPRV